MVSTGIKLLPPHNFHLRIREVPREANGVVSATLRKAGWRIRQRYHTCWARAWQVLVGLVPSRFQTDKTRRLGTRPRPRLSPYSKKRSVRGKLESGWRVRPTFFSWLGAVCHKWINFIGVFEHKSPATVQNAPAQHACHRWRSHPYPWWLAFSTVTCMLVVWEGS